MCRCVPKPVPFKIGDHTIYGTGFGKFGKEGPVSIKGFDVAVLLDGWAGSEFLKASKPWKSPKVFCFEIRDMSVPKDLTEFGRLLDYLAEALESGKKVVIGCIGGHGRTGLVMAALHHKMTGTGQGMKAVRSGYCKKAIESKEQIDWLYNTYGLTKVEASKSYARGKTGQVDWLGEFDRTTGRSLTSTRSRGRKPQVEKSKDFPETASTLFDKTLISGKLW